MHFVLLAISEEAKKNVTSIFLFSLLDSVFVISRIIKVSVRVISLSLRRQLITPTSTFIILDITKTSSNNYCLLSSLSPKSNLPFLCAYFGELRKEQKTVNNSLPVPGFPQLFFLLLCDPGMVVDNEYLTSSLNFFIGKADIFLHNISNHSNYCNVT